MAYKTILVHLDRKEKAVNRIRIAANLAKSQDAYLIGAAMVGISTLSFREANIDQKDPALAAHLRFLTERAQGFVNDFNHEVENLGVLAYEGRIVDEEASYGISIQARYADLVVIGLTDYEDKSSTVQSDFPESVLIHAGRPTLMIPPKWQKETVGSNILISWNASKEVRRAVTDAIPILKQAEVVDVAMFNVESEPDMHDDASVRDLAVYLARHGVTVHVLQPKNVKNVGEALLDIAAERGNDLLVMGGYGSTRFRQFLLGGVTRTILGEATIPVLMSH